MFKRKNPMPMSGALFLSNPRKKSAGAKAASKSSTKTRKAKRPSVAKRIIARLNRSMSHMKMNRRRKRKNGLALRANGLALRTNRRRRAKRKNGLALRMNGLALRANRRRRVKRNRKHAAIVRMNRKHSVVLKNRRRRRNAGKGLVTSAKSGAMGLVAPLAYGAAAGALHLYALRFVGGYLPDMLKPVGYTLGGIAVKGLLSLKFMPGSAAMKKQLGDAAVIIGAAFDVTRAIKGTSSEFGDGGFYTLGGHTRPFDAVERVISAQYSDATAADALHTTEDLADGEVDAAMSGGAVWAHRFPFIARQQHARGMFSRHAGQAGHRWGWLVRMIGWENFRRLAASHPAKRKAYLQRLREHALRALQEMQIAQNNLHPAQVIAAGARPARVLSMASAPSEIIEPSDATGLSGAYGATLFAGGPF